MIYYAGDIHARPDALGRLEMSARDKGATAIVQVGDFGALWPDGLTRDFDDHLRKRFKKFSDIPIYTCGGNHENWPKYFELQAEQNDSDLVELVDNSNVFYVKRGAVIEIDGMKHIFYGGAESTDIMWRTEGLSWWPEETPTHAEFTRFCENLEKHKPEVVVTHDCPIRLPLDRYSQGHIVDRNGLKTSVDLENVLKHSNHLPKRWFFGHYHRLEHWNEMDIDFYCCGLHGDYWRWPLDPEGPMLMRYQR